MKTRYHYQFERRSKRGVWKPVTQFDGTEREAAALRSRLGGVIRYWIRARIV